MNFTHTSKFLLKRTGLWLFALALVILTGTEKAEAYLGLCCTKCGGNMPLNIPGGGVPETKEFRFKLSYMSMKMDGLRDKSQSIDSNQILGMPMMGGMATGKYMAAPTKMDMNMFNFTTGYSFSQRFFGAVMLMPKDNSMDMSFNSAMQSMTGQKSFTMESKGLADTMLMLKYLKYADNILAPKKQLSFLFSLSLPTGSIDEKNSNHPLAMRQSEQLPYDMQLGSGTLDPTFGLLYEASASPYWWGANLKFTPRLYDNKRDYRLGNEFKVDLYSIYQVNNNLLFQFQLLGEFKNKIKGQMDESLSGVSGRVIKGNANSPFMTPLWDVNNTGNRKIITTVGFQWQPFPLHILDLNIGVPLFTRNNGIALKEDYRVIFTWYLERPTRGSIRHRAKLEK